MTRRRVKRKRQRMQRASSDDDVPDPGTAMIAATAIAAGSQIMGGISANKAAKTEAGLLEQQGILQQQDAMTAAAQKANEVRQARATQGHIYLSSGVTLEGTPLQVMEDTRQKGQAEVDALVARGAALKKLAGMQAQQTRSSGRSALIQGILGAGATAAGGLYQAQGGKLAGTLSAPPANPAFYNFGARR